MRISISGTHSAGKTTLLNKMKTDKDFKESGLTFIDGVTRQVKAMGIPINEAGADATQLMCLSMDLKNLYQHVFSNDNKVVISDRCMLDTYIYTKYLFNHEKVSQSTFEAIGLIWKNHIHYYDLILMPSHFEVPLSDDGERSVNRSFRDEIYRLFLEEVNLHSTTLQTLMIGGTVKERMIELKSIILNK